MNIRTEQSPPIFSERSKGYPRNSTIYSTITHQAQAASQQPASELALSRIMTSLILCFSRLLPPIRTVLTSSQLDRDVNGRSRRHKSASRQRKLAHGDDGL